MNDLVDYDYDRRFELGGVSAVGVVTAAVVLVGVSALVAVGAWLLGRVEDALVRLPH